jgi:phospholipase A1/A2
VVNAFWIRDSAIRKWLRALAAALVLAGGAEQVAAQEPSLVLQPLSRSAPQASTIEVDVLAVNRSAVDTDSPLGEQFTATISVERRSWPVTLRAEVSSGAPARVRAGGIVSRRYVLALPSGAHGRAVLEITDSSGSLTRSAIDIAEPDIPVRGPENETRVARIDAFEGERTFSGRLSVYEPSYLIAGPDQPKGKIQISFKYRLFTFSESHESEEPAPPRTLQFAYTQRSLWEFGPFYDTSYMPELAYQWFATTTSRSEIGGSTWLGLQSGLRHESNGRSGSAARSVNTVYVRPLFSIGSPDGWHVVLAPEFYGYVGGLAYNPDLNRYRGNSELRVTVGKGNGPSLMLTALPGEHFEHGSRQLDLSIPVRIPFTDLRSYLLVQYFDGYGESLLAYNQHTSAYRAGIEFVR